MGFMVLNDRTYPNLLRIFSEIGADVEDSDMSLSVHDGRDFSWSFRDLLSGQMRSIVQPRMWKLVVSYRAFVKKAVKVLSEHDRGVENSITVGEFCEGLDETFCVEMALPFVSAVWSVGYGTATNLLLFLC